MIGSTLRTFRVSLLAVVCLAAGFARAAWYWPFDFDPDSTNKPPRLHRLLEKANDYIELAEDDALAGEGDRAIENYRLALAELDRVEEEHPERAESPEFAPLRNKRATCAAAIDAIRFAQIAENARPVALTDTRELERKWRRKHGLQTPEDLEEDRREEARRKAEKARRDQAKPGEQKKQADGAPDAKKTPVAATPFETRRTAALEKLRGGDYAAADALLEELSGERPDDLTTLLLRAAAQAGLGREHAARRTLEKAVQKHPESYLPLYNLANLSLRLGEPVSVARDFYEKGRAAGGPRDEAMEKRFK